MHDREAMLHLHIPYSTTSLNKPNELRSASINRNAFVTNEYPIQTAHRRSMLWLYIVRQLVITGSYD